MSRWAKHDGALAHISQQRSVEMLALQCAQRFPARPVDPDSSVFAELFPAPQPEPLQPNVPTAKAKQMHLNWNSLSFLSELSQQKSVTRFPPEIWQAFLCRSFGAPIPKMQPTLSVARFALARCASILWMIMSSLASSTQILFAVTIISWMW